MNSMSIADKTRIEIRNLSFYYGETKALKNISLPLYDRKVTAFIGPSGCGKSTLLRVLNRIYALYPNHAFGQKLYERLSKSELDERVKTALERAALWGEVKDKLNVSGLSLSGG